MQDAAQVVDFQRANPAVVPHTVNGRAADIIFMRKRVCAFAGTAQRLPKRRIDNHGVHQRKILKIEFLYTKLFF